MPRIRVPLPRLALPTMRQWWPTAGIPPNIDFHGRLVAARKQQLKLQQIQIHHPASTSRITDLPASPTARAV